MVYKTDADKIFNVILKCMWSLVGFMAMYIFFLSVVLVAFPDKTMGLIMLIPEMVECVLVSCLVISGLGCLFEYLQK